MALTVILLISSLGVLPTGLRAAQAQGGDVPEWKANPPSSVPAGESPARAQDGTFAAPIQATHIYTDSTGISVSSFLMTNSRFLCSPLGKSASVENLRAGRSSGPTQLSGVIP